MPNDAREQLRRRVETWREAGRELKAIRRRDAESVTLQEAVRELFDGMDAILTAPAPATSGLVEQQIWFSGKSIYRQLRSKRMNPLPEAAVDVQKLRDSWKLRFCIIGGIALLR